MNQSSLYGTYDSESQRRAAYSPDPQHPKDLRDIPDIKKFDPDKLLTNEIKNGEYGTLAKIPKIRGRITRKDTPNGTYIQFIHDRVYLPEKKQSRNRKTIIGQSTEPLLQGMMLVNEKYYQFFDHQGNMIYKGEKPENEPDAEEPKNDLLEETEYEEIPEKADKALNPGSISETHFSGHDSKAEKEESGEISSSDQREQGQKVLGQAEQEKKTPTENIKPYTAEITAEPTAPQEETVSNPEQTSEGTVSNSSETTPKTLEEVLEAYENLKAAYQTIKAEYEDLDMRCLVEMERAKQGHLQFLWKILFEYQKTVAIQAKRKPDAPMTWRQIQQIEDLLLELRDIFQDAEGSEYLKSPIIPIKQSESDGDEEANRITNGEMSLLLAPYDEMIGAYFGRRLWKKEKQ